MFRFLKIKYLYEANKSLKFINKFIATDRKIFGVILNIVIKLLIKIIYIGIFVYMPCKLWRMNQNFITCMFIILTLVESFLYEKFGLQDKDIIIANTLKLDKTKFTFAIFSDYLVTTFILNFITLIMFNIPFFDTLIFSFISVFINIIVASIRFKANEIIANTLQLLTIGMCILFYVFKIPILTPFSYLLFFASLAILSTIYLSKQTNYNKLYDVTNVDEERRANHIVGQNNVDAKQFGKLLIQRNRRAIFEFQIVVFVIITISLIVILFLSFTSETVRKTSIVFFNEYYFLIIMIVYLLNNKMIYNVMNDVCDLPLKNYSFFMKKTIQNKVLKERLFCVLKINLLPIIIIISLLFIYMLTLNMSIKFIVIYVISIIVLCIVFTILNLLFYYLVGKKNINMFDNIYLAIFIVIYFILKDY